MPDMSLKPDLWLNLDPVSMDVSSGENRSNLTEIMPFLFLGGNMAAEDVESLRQKGITYVLNTAKECVPSAAVQSAGLSGEIVYLKCDLLDRSSEDLGCFLSQAFAFIEEARKACGKVLVHCRHGVSRSASLVIAYLMSCHDMHLRAAYNFVKGARPEICPNLGFLLVLENMQDQLYPDEQEETFDYEPSTPLFPAPSARRMLQERRSFADGLLVGGE
jgi:hypothetical protein